MKGSQEEKAKSKTGYVPTAFVSLKLQKLKP